MNIESVKLLKTLKAGENTWKEGTVFPNKTCPYIPKEIIGEAALGRPTVKILSEKPEEGKIIVSKPIFKDSSEDETNTTLNVESSIRNKELDKPFVEQKSEEMTRSKPKLKKRSLVKRK